MKDQPEKDCVFCGRSMKASRWLDICPKCRVGLQAQLQRAANDPEVQEAKRLIETSKRRVAWKGALSR